jgi:hypothetical protein
MHNSGAPRREVGKVRLRTTPLLFENRIRLRRPGERREP